MVQRLAGRRLIAFVFSILSALAVLAFLFFRIISYQKVTGLMFVDVFLVGGASTCALLAIFLRNYWIYLGSVLLMLIYGILATLVCHFFGHMSYHHESYKPNKHERAVIEGLVGVGLGVGVLGISCCVVPGVIIYCYNFFYDMEAKAILALSYEKVPKTDKVDPNGTKPAPEAPTSSQMLQPTFVSPMLQERSNAVLVMSAEPEQPITVK